MKERCQYFLHSRHATPAFRRRASCKTACVHTWHGTRFSSARARCEYVEIRTAFGPEQDGYFDWTAFPVAAATVPEPAVPAMLALGLLGVAIAQRRRRSMH